jgi:hypothetical protein
VLSILEIMGSRGLQVWHAHGQFSAMTLRPFGMTGVVYPLSWVDRGMPAPSPTGGHPSCQTYVSSLHHCVDFAQAARLAGDLTAAQYLERYCGCHFCSEAVRAGNHPLELMLEITHVDGPRGRQRRPTERSLGFNRWHYLWARHQEAVDLASGKAIDILQRDMLRSRGLGDSGNLRKLADLLRAA